MTHVTRANALYTGGTYVTYRMNLHESYSDSSWREARVVYFWLGEQKVLCGWINGDMWRQEEERRERRGGAKCRSKENRDVRNNPRHKEQQYRSARQVAPPLLLVPRRPLCQLLLQGYPEPTSGLVLLKSTTLSNLWTAIWIILMIKVYKAAMWKEPL